MDEDNGTTFAPHNKFFTSITTVTNVLSVRGVNRVYWSNFKAEAITKGVTVGYLLNELLEDRYE